MTVLPSRVVLATRNRGKLDEFRMMFAAAGIAVEDLVAAGLPDEDSAEAELEVHATFEENARAKARWFAAQLPGQVVLADDSGLEVAALDGAPGVQSRRWAGSTGTGPQLDDANNEALLRALSGSPSRRARYVAVVACVDGEREWIARGECVGRVLESSRGRGGFGYDPLFWSDELGASFGEVSREVKSGVSHRRRAFEALLGQWRAERVRSTASR